jgi:hypothetical protein
MYFNDYDESSENNQLFGASPSFNLFLRDNDSFQFVNDNYWCEPSFVLNEQKSNNYCEAKDDFKEPKGLNFEEINPNKNVDDLYNTKLENEKINKEDENKNSTRPTSDKKEDTKINKIHKFKTQKTELPAYWRMDMVKKHWKSKISDYAKDKLNELIERSELPNKIKQTIHVPDSKKFTSNVTVTANAQFLDYNMIDIFTIGKDTENLPKQNFHNISQILEYFRKVGYDKLSDNLRTLKDFLEMSYEDLIRMFYNSYEFLEFKNENKTIFYDEGLIKQEQFSLLKEYGLIKLFKMIKKKRNRD